MLFNSQIFAIFLPLVFILYWFAFNRNLRLPNLFLLVASYTFYGWWDWRFLSLIFISSLSDYIIGILLNRNSRRANRRILLWISLGLNLGILGFFKYFNFFVDSFINLANKIGVHLNESTLNIILPVGISFYTFQTLSYTIDIYRKRIEPTKDIISFFAFVSFFPQLVAGPIERASNLLPQFQKPRVFNVDIAKDGLRQILWGLIKKVVIADTIGVNVNEIFDAASYSSTSGITLIVGSLLFTFQIYCDFSGYSDIAIGTAKLLGFRLMRNFAYPFFSRNIGELWHRWHISLSTWFRDYVFIPMGGSRVTTIKYLRNIILTFAISGLWHGANWTFVIWGVLNGLYYIPMLFSKEKGKYTGIVASDSLFPNVKDFLKMILTFTLFSFSMIFFRSESLQDAGDYIYYLVSNFLFNTEVVLAWLTSSSVIMVFVLVIVEWFQRRKEYSLQIQDFPLLLRWAIYISAMAVFIYYGNFGSDQQFIYFQF